MEAAYLVWSTALPGRPPQMQYVDLLEGKKPPLLTSIKNNLGLDGLALHRNEQGAS